MHNKINISTLRTQSYSINDTESREFHDVQQPANCYNSQTNAERHNATETKDKDWTRSNTEITYCNSFYYFLFSFSLIYVLFVLVDCFKFIVLEVRKFQILLNCKGDQIYTLIHIIKFYVEQIFGCIIKLN